MSQCADLLSTLETYPLLYTRYSTFSPELDSFHTADTADLRTFFNSMSSSTPYPLTSYDEIALSPAKIVNISNTNGGSSSDLVKQFDQFVELNDMVACTAHSSLAEGNWTTSGMSYNSMVVGQPYVNINALDGAKINDHGSPRFKPDLITHTKSYATSYSTPTVCSAAAMLLHRVNVDSNLSTAWNSVVIKAILMAGATRYNYKVSTDWGEGISQASINLFTQGDWQRVSDSHPTSEKYGAGALHILSSYNILDAGEFNSSIYEVVESQGWDHESGYTEGQTFNYNFAIEQNSMFSAVLVWHRIIDDALNSYLPDYSVTLFDTNNQPIASSDNLSSNVELIEHKLPPGDYSMKVYVKSNGGTDDLSFGLAWTAKIISPLITELNLSEIEENYQLQWSNSETNVDDFKYRIEVSTTANFVEVESEIFTDNSNYSMSIPEDQQQRYFRIYSYPQDSNVAYQYPSTAVSSAIFKDGFEGVDTQSLN